MPPTPYDGVSPRRQHYWRIAVALLVCAGITAWGLWWWPRSVPAQPSPADCRRAYPVGPFAVRLCAHPLLPGDSGPVEIAVSVDDQAVGTIASDYSDDTLMALPAAALAYRWIDGDWWPDLVIDPHAAATGRPRHFIGSHTGRLAIVPATDH